MLDKGILLVFTTLLIGFVAGCYYGKHTVCKEVIQYKKDINIERCN